MVAAVYSKAAVDKLDTAPGAGISDGGALLLELIATALFVIVICTVATDDRAPWKGVMAPLLIGLFTFTAADAIGPASGGSFNPARSLDPALFNWDFGDIWIYLVGPLAGGADRRSGLVALPTGPRARGPVDPLYWRRFADRERDANGWGRAPAGVAGLTVIEPAHEAGSDPSRRVDPGGVQVGGGACKRCLCESG